MAKRTATATTPSTIAQRFSHATIREMDLLRWFVALANNPTDRDTDKGEKKPDIRDSRNQIATQALMWFAKPSNNKTVVYPTLTTKWVFVSFEVPRELYRAITAIATREDVRVARVIETAIQCYCAASISDEMTRYYKTVQKHGSALLRALETKRDK